jgi:hypothetical protein
VRRRPATPVIDDLAGGASGYHPAMSKLLLNLRHVPDDEADDVRSLLDAGGIGYYETDPSPWGISAGGIWIRDDRDVAEAKRLMAEYQHERQARARAERAEAERNGTAETFVDVLRTQPLAVVLTVIGIALILALMAVPVLLLWK